MWTLQPNPRSAYGARHSILAHAWTSQVHQSDLNLCTAVPPLWRLLLPLPHCPRSSGSFGHGFSGRPMLIRTRQALVRCKNCGAHNCNVSHQFKLVALTDMGWNIVVSWLQEMDALRRSHLFFISKALHVQIGTDFCSFAWVYRVCTPVYIL
jgi:hypothetical protein